MKKEFKVIIAVILAVWFFLMGFELGTYRERKSQQEPSTVPVVNTTVEQTTALQPLTTAAPVTTTAPVPETTASSEISTAAEQTTEAETESDDPASLSKEQVVEKLSTALNQVKSEQNMTAKKNETVTINVTDCSVQRAVSLINNVISGLAGEETVTYNFTNGQAVGIDAEGNEVDDGASVSPNDVIPPKSKSFSLASDGVKEATAAKDGENTVYTVTLAEESTTYNSPVPQYHSNAYGYLDLTSLDLTGVSITDANMNYPETVITATVNADGKLTRIHFYMPMTGDGTAKIIGLSGNATFEGADDETWEFTY